MKLVGGDSGRVEHQEFVESVVLAPSERAVVDVLVDRPGEVALEHHTPDRTYRLAQLLVAPERAERSRAEEFEQLGRAPELEAERRQLDRWLAAPADKVLALVAQMDDPAAMPAGAGPVTYACPMHPEVTSEEPGRCPTCGMKLLATQAPAATVYACPMHPEVVSDQPGRCPKCGMKLLATAAPTSYVCPMHPEVTSDEPGHCPKCGMKLLPAESVPKSAATADAAAMDEHGGRAAGHDHGEGHDAAEGIEWEDDMVEVNRLTTTATMHWRFLDRTSGGVTEPNLVWKDTVLVRTGQVVDILFDVSNPGLWMAHCHIAEHMQSGMMFSFNVARAQAVAP
jgi:FtsP/CotA-like multicopper oxidase with cupredoxin domain